LFRHGSNLAKASPKLKPDINWH